MNTKQMMMAAAMIVAASPGAMAAHGPRTNVSATLQAGTVTLVIPAPTAAVRVYERLVNVGTSGVAWCSRFDPQPAPNKPGSFPLAPFGNSLGQPSAEEFADAQSWDVSTPQAPLACTADSGTAILTGEVSAP